MNARFQTTSILGPLLLIFVVKPKKNHRQTVKISPTSDGGVETDMYPISLRASYANKAGSLRENGSINTTGMASLGGSTSFVIVPWLVWSGSNNAIIRRLFVEAFLRK